MQHKKRGRPRLRDDRDFSRPEDGRQQPSQILGAVPASGEAFPHSDQTLHLQRLSDASRYSGIQGEEQGPNIRSQRTSSVNEGQLEGRGGVAVSPYPAGTNLAYQMLPVAFLDLDLVIQKSNRAFQDLVAFLGNVRGKHLGDILEARLNDSLQRLRNDLRFEKDEREPTYMAPITPIGEDPMRPVLENLADRDVDQVSHGFTERSMYLSFSTSNGQYQSLPVQVRLAKTSHYFVTLVVRAPTRTPGPPLLTQQFAPPTPSQTSQTPSQTSQTMSAPTTAGGRDFTPHQAHPPSLTSSAPNSPYFNFSSVRTSLPTVSPSSYGSSPSYGYSPTTGADSGYFPTIQPPSHAYPRNMSVTSEPKREANRPPRLEGLHLPPIRTGPAPLGSPLHFESLSAADREREFVRRRVSSPNADEQRPETPETGKRRRLNIHEVLE